MPRFFQTALLVYAILTLASCNQSNPPETSELSKEDQLQAEIHERLLVKKLFANEITVNELVVPYANGKPAVHARIHNGAARVSVYGWQGDTGKRIEINSFLSGSEISMYDENNNRRTSLACFSDGGDVTLFSDEGQHKNISLTEHGLIKDGVVNLIE